MIGKQIMTWLQSRFASSAEKRLDETISASLDANASVSELAAGVKDSAVIDQAWMENVAFDAQRRAEASEARHAKRARDPHLAVVMDTMRIMENRQ